MISLLIFPLFFTTISHSSVPGFVKLPLFAYELFRVRTWSGRVVFFTFRLFRDSLSPFASAQLRFLQPLHFVSARLIDELPSGVLSFLLPRYSTILLLSHSDLVLRSNWHPCHLELHQTGLAAFLRHWAGERLCLPLDLLFRGPSIVLLINSLACCARVIFSLFCSAIESLCTFLFLTSNFWSDICRKNFAVDLSVASQHPSVIWPPLACRKATSCPPVGLCSSSVTFTF